MKTFRFRDFEIWKRLCVSYVRPRIEYAIQLRNPFMHGNVNVLARIRQRTKKRAHTSKTNPGNEKHKKIDKRDLKTSEKIVNKFNLIDWPICAPPREGR